MAEITIYWKPIGGVPGTYHQFLLYNDGTTTYFARGGPQYQTSGDTTIHGFGQIITQWGEYVPGSTRDYPTGDDPAGTLASWPHQTIISGDVETIGPVWNNITAKVDQIGQQGIEYSPSSTNSNSVVGTAISSTGLAVPDAGPFSGHWAPGASNNLDDAQDTLMNPFSAEYPSPLENRDPLVIDLDGNGIELTNVAGSAVHFDYGGTGFAPTTGWVAPTEGILVHNIGVSGAVTASNLFGASSGNGFQDLAQFDSNADGKIDSSDTNFGDLKVWVDADSDGGADGGEVITLTEADIAAINLNQQASGQAVNGNIIVEAATFVRSDDSTGTIAEVNFATDALLSRYTPPEGFEYSPTALDLPSLIGYGKVPNLIYSMSLDPDLEDAVHDLVMDASSTSGGDFDAAFENLMQVWAGVDDTNPAGRGPFIDGRHLALVEAFYGTTFEQANGASATLSQVTARDIEATYQAILSELKVRFVAEASQSQLANGASWASVESSPLLPFASIQFLQSSDQVVVDFSQLIVDLTQHAPTDNAGKIAYFDFAARVIKSLRVDRFSDHTDDLICAFQTAAADASLHLGMRALVVAELQADHVLAASDFMGAVTGSAKADAILIDEAGHTVSGGAGADSYIYTKTATGNSTISDAGFHSDDALILADAVPADVTLSRTGASNDFVMTLAGGGTLTIDEQFQVDGYGTIETFRFADGTVWTAAGIRQMLLDQGEAASSGGIYGYDGVNDTIVAGLGDKYMSGLSGNDTYVYSLAGGNDTIDDRYWFSTDTLQLTDIDSGDVTLSRHAIDLRRGSRSVTPQARPQPGTDRHRQMEPRARRCRHESRLRLRPPRRTSRSHRIGLHGFDPRFQLSALSS